MNYKCAYAPAQGRTHISGPGDGGMQQIGFDLLQLAAGEEYQMAAGGFETALVILGGKATVRGEGFAFENIGERADVFSGKPATVFVPPQTACVIAAVTALEVAICQAASEKPGQPLLIKPEDVKDVTIGKDNWRRRAFMMVDDRVPAEFLFIGEAFVPSGNWSSYPPHRHDIDDLPNEVNLEELYFYRFNPKGGFGIQMIYTDDRSINESIRVEENDTVLIPQGYHPVISAPGYSMYYLWVMAGVNRRFLQRLDPAHRWVAQS